MRVLLLDGSYMVMPNFNKFVTRRMSTHCSNESGVFLPPLEAIKFGPRLAVGSSLLTLSCIRACSVDCPRTLHHVRSRMIRVERSLRGRNGFRVRGVNVLFLGRSKGVDFRPYRTNVLAPSFCNLNNFSVLPVTRVSGNRRRGRGRGITVAMGLTGRRRPIGGRTRTPTTPTGGSMFVTRRRRRRRGTRFVDVGGD